LEDHAVGFSSAVGRPQAGGEARRGSQLRAGRRASGDRCRQPGDDLFVRCWIAA